MSTNLSIFWKVLFHIHHIPIMPHLYDNVAHNSELYPRWLAQAFTAAAAAATTTLPLLALFTAAVLAISFYFHLKKSTSQVPPLPPGPLGLPLVGSLPFLPPTNFHQYLAKLSQTYGPIMTLKLGSKICIVISSPSVAKTILKDHDTTFSNRDVPASAKAIAYGGIDVAWSPNSPHWRKMRKVFVHNLMSRSSLEACYEHRRREVREMVRDIHGKLGTGIDIGEQMFLTVLSLTTGILRGGALHGEERKRIGGEMKTKVEEIVEMLGGKPNVSDFFPALARFDLQGIEKKMKKISQWFDGIFDSLIESRVLEKGNEEESQDLLQILLKMKKQGDEETSLSMDEIKAILMDTIVAAPDTTSVAVEWAMAEMLTHPDKKRRAREEIDEVVGKDNIVEESHLPKLLYLDAVLKETLRLHSPVPLMVPRSPNKTCTVVGYSIPENSKVLFNTWAIQRDPNVWDNALEFEPERFLNDYNKGDYNGNEFEYFPFGSGRRICAGIPLAEKMMKYVLATLLHSFEWELPEGVELDLGDKFGFVLKKAVPLVAVPIARLPKVEQYL